MSGSVLFSIRDFCPPTGGDGGCARRAGRLPGGGPFLFPKRKGEEKGPREAQPSLGTPSLHEGPTPTMPSKSRWPSATLARCFLRAWQTAGIEDHWQPWQKSGQDFHSERSLCGLALNISNAIREALSRQHGRVLHLEVLCKISPVLGFQKGACPLCPLVQALSGKGLAPSAQDARPARTSPVPPAGGQNRIPIVRTKRARPRQFAGDRPFDRF